MEALSIKIKIGEREYPMRVDPEDEERIRQAGRMLNEQIQQYRRRYHTTDKQDLLAVVAFDAFVEKLDYQTRQTETEKVIVDKVSRINRLINQTIS
ncbi:MAG: cell division protein ZapA [Bacteroidota bacterium]